MGLRAVAGGSAAVTRIVAGTGITVTPTSGVGSVTVANAGVLSLISGSSLITLDNTTGAISLSVSSTIVVNTRAINTSSSITGGGDLTSDRTITLVNDSAAPGNSKYYGTDAGGIKGFFSLPAGGSGTVTQIDVGTGLATSSTGSTASITTTGTIYLKNTTVTAGTYGTTDAVATFQVNAQGQLVTAANLNITLDATAITAGTLALARHGLSASSGGVVYGTATNLGITAAGTTGQHLQSQGTAAPTWTTATYPSVAATQGTFLTSDGTNVVISSYTVPTAIGALGTFLRSNGTNIVTSSYTVPTAIGAIGTFLASNGTDIVTSSYTIPTAIGTLSTFLQSDGTNVVASAYTLPAALTINGILYASATGTAAQVTVVNSAALVTNSSGVPSLTASASGTVLRSSDGITNAFGKVDLTTDVTGALPVANGGSDPLFGWLQYT